ncbi:MAG: serine/threonine protein kinase, partial [Betaproteobacteria bacterium]
MNRRPEFRGALIALACAVTLVVAGWADADAAGRGGSRGGGGMSRSSPARSGGMSSRPAPQRSAQP